MDRPGACGGPLMPRNLLLVPDPYRFIMHGHDMDGGMRPSKKLRVFIHLLSD